MQTESDIGQYDIREVDENFPRGVRRSEHNTKLPPLAPSNKNAEMDYAKRNMEIIKQLKEKKQKQQELIEEKRKKEADEREKLRQLILEEAARVRELKKQNIALQQETDQKEDEEKSFRGKKSKAKENKEKEDEETEKEKEDKAKLQHYYRSRHASFLKSLKENLKSKKEREEQEKKKKDDVLCKIRENMGINNITSKLYSVEKNLNEKHETAMDEQTLNVKKVSSSEAKRASSVEGRTLPIEVQRELLQRQKKILAEISERKKLEKLEEEEKQKHYLKIKEKLKDKVLNMGKRVDGYETAGFVVERKVLVEDPASSQNLKALNLDSVETKRQRFKKSLGSLPPIRDKYLSENDDGQKESSSLPKIPESTKSSKSGKKNPKKKLANIPNITDMVQWKKRHRIDPEARIYNVNGGYGDIKAALDKRGWIENSDFSSPCFDFKWTLRAKDIDHGNLLENQIVNHFEKNTSITTKVGLCKSLKNLIWFNNVDIDTFYPRCFDLTDVADYEDFLDEFKRVKAESILKQYVTACKNNDPKVKDMELRVQVAARVCENRLIDLDELLDDQTMISQMLVSPEEWEILANDELSAKDLALKKHEAWLSKYDITNGPKCAIKKKKAEKAKKKKKKKKAVKETEDNNNNNKEEEGEGEEDDNVSENELLDRVETILEELKGKYPQYGLNGEKNIWIVKPAGLSRGRGISCFKNLIEIQDYVKGKESQWIVQKYMENPLIIHKRKFDIRQWILVTDWNPLTVWFYEECYVRFSAEEYDTHNLDNKFVHLTNNSIGKYHENQNCPTFEQNMWGMEAFSKYLEQTFGSGTFEEKIKPQMKQIVTWALECVQDMVENRKGSHEFYGVDFMIDEDLNVWLIEINSSPDMEYSTPVTKRLVKTVSDDIIKVVVDYNLNPTKKKKKEIDTGLFTCIHKSKRTIEKPLNSFGLDLLLEGKKISK